jgi:hypothetical protein
VDCASGRVERIRGGGHGSTTAAFDGSTVRERAKERKGKRKKKGA